LTWYIEGERGGHLNSVIDLLTAHRSIRKFKPDPISTVDLHAIVDAAQSASTSSLIQAYSIIHVTDSELRRQLAHLAGDQVHIEECPVFLVFCADLYRLKIAAEMHGLVMKGEHMEAFILATVDTALAAQNAMVAAESLGLGGVYIGGIRNNPERISRLLELPDKVYPVFGMCLGKPAHDPGKKPRLPLTSVLKENRYTTGDDDSLLQQYDETIRQYYNTRTGGRRTEGWTHQMAKKMSNENRLHMRSFLEGQGFGFN
jgi:nitroreductase